ncbi:MAG: hypothetical protein AVDCRST_MAG70-2218, partial [uncultured Thermomicrobiales bacterium]
GDAHDFPRTPAEPGDRRGIGRAPRPTPDLEPGGGPRLSPRVGRDHRGGLLCRCPAHDPTGNQRLRHPHPAL